MPPPLAEAVLELIILSIILIVGGDFTYDDQK